MVKGRWYTPRHEPGYDQSGIASWYGADFHGRKTANGEINDQGALTAAHPTLPLPSYAEVTNLANGRTLLVRINDRGPYAHDRIIDLSQAAARHLQFERQGTARVRVRYLGPAPLDGNDSAERRHLAQQPWIAGGPYASTLQPGWQQGYGLGYRR
jgi:rare lipoprotein A